MSGSPVLLATLAEQSPTHRAQEPKSEGGGCRSQNDVYLTQISPLLQLLFQLGGIEELRKRLIEGNRTHGAGPFIHVYYKIISAEKSHRPFEIRSDLLNFLTQDLNMVHRSQMSVDNVCVQITWNPMICTHTLSTDIISFPATNKSILFTSPIGGPVGPVPSIQYMASTNVKVG